MRRRMTLYSMWTVQFSINHIFIVFFLSDCLPVNQHCRELNVYRIRKQKTMSHDIGKCQGVYIIAPVSGMRNFRRAHLGTLRNSSNSRDEAITARYLDVKLPLTTPLAWRWFSSLRFNIQTNSNLARVMNKNRNWRPIYPAVQRLLVARTTRRLRG